LSADLIEEIRLLSNLNTNDATLLQLVLVGQPELDETLDSVGLPGWDLSPEPLF